MAWLIDLVAGQCSASEACRALGLRRTQLYDLRGRMLRAALDALEPGRRGRPPRRQMDATTAAAEVTQLRSRVAELERELALARAQALVAGLLIKRGRDSLGS